MHRERGSRARKAFLQQCEDELGANSDPSAMLFVRIREFDEFRSRHGYGSADALSDAACDAVESLLRPGDSACRIDDDAFAIFLSRLLSENHALLAANRLQRIFQRDINVDGSTHPIEPAIGITHAPTQGHTAGTLLQQADRASQQAMTKRVPIERFVPPRPHDDIPKAALRSAILGNRMQVWLQPIWDLQKRRIVGVESLSRWMDTEYGMVSPGDFVPLAERTDLIGDFTRWCLNATLRHTADLRRVRPDMHVSINFSPRLFIEDDIVEQVVSSLEIWNVPPSALVLEVTEGATMEDAERSAEMLTRFRNAGIGVALDDFGIGHSSFAYLRQFPVSALKIDKSFVGGLRDSERSRQLVHSMIDLTHNLGVTSIAEGVEDAATLGLLQELGCDCVQGYHIAHPQPAEKMIESLRGGG